MSKLAKIFTWESDSQVKIKPEDRQYRAKVQNRLPKVRRRKDHLEFGLEILLAQDFFPAMMSAATLAGTIS